MNQSQQIISELRPANPVTILGDLTSPKNKAVEKRLAVVATIDGAVALIRADDGNVYEVVIRAAVDGKFKARFGKILLKKGEGLSEDVTQADIDHALAAMEGSLNNLGALPNTGADPKRKKKRKVIPIRSYPK